MVECVSERCGVGSWQLWRTVHLIYHLIVGPMLLLRVVLGENLLVRILTRVRLPEEKLLPALGQRHPFSRWTERLERRRLAPTH
jgi:hypothetical protein